MDIEIKTWIDKINEIKLPRWNDLPNIELYSEQVITYVNSHLNTIFINHDNQKDTLVTASMINNYVKQKIMSPPENKKYRKSHLAFIITITVLKQVGNLNDVKKGIMNLTTTLGKIEAYDTFIDFLERSLKSSMNELLQTPDQSYYMMPVTIDLLPLKTATLAFTSVMLSRYLFSKIEI
ncbi:DUF1836 domain-containing protein [Acholeplasma granularum]|uniref:DUF1836 domain-containing protein n=1 Tax=Acholeplasma granularum TaxID=264635 RepID=UPI0004718709|nr:DUF1836 domain-containing protein [Acholeplasma granularum]